MWDEIVLIPDHCLSVDFSNICALKLYLLGKYTAKHSLGDVCQEACIESVISSMVFRRTPYMWLSFPLQQHKCKSVRAVLHILVLVMNSFNTAESALYMYLAYLSRPKDLTIQNVFMSTAAGVVPCGGRKTSPIHPHSADYIFVPLGSLSSFRIILKKCSA